MIVYAVEPRLDAEAFIDLLRRSTLDQRRPVDEPARIARMLTNSNLIVTARSDGRLIGVARALADFGFACYLSDLAVDREWQRRGIGRALMARVHAEAGGDETMLLLLAAPAAADYYPHVGFAKVEAGWMLPRKR